MSMAELIDIRDWYFTFGCGHKYAGYYVKITADYGTARNWMFKKYGSKWAFQYGEDRFEDAIAQYRYKELEHITEEPIIENIEQIDT